VMDILLCVVHVLGKHPHVGTIRIELLCFSALGVQGHCREACSAILREMPCRLHTNMAFGAQEQGTVGSVSISIRAGVDMLHSALQRYGRRSRMGTQLASALLDALLATTAVDPRAARVLMAPGLFLLINRSRML
jgi:hypothetical protein